MISTGEKRTISIQNNTNILDASFSSYLNDSQDTFIRKLAQSSHPHNLLVPISPHSPYIGKKKVEDGEIGIFGAEKYFTGAIDEDISVISLKGSNPSSSSGKDKEEKEVVPDELPVKHKAQSATPSVQSEASWNSRSAFLHGNQRNRQRNKEMNKVSNLKSFFAVLGCNCNGKGSVEIKEEINEDRRETTKPPVKAGDLVVRTTKSLSSRWAEEEIQSKKLDPNPKREDCFSFPVVNPKAGDDPVVHRNSPEVFGSPVMEKAKKSLTLGRKLTMLNWDGVTPRSRDIEIPYNDSESDASSDLFEIESFSTNGNSSFPGRHTLDGMLKPSNGGYAPSEASIDWSVATASAADISVISAYQEIRNGTAKNSSGIAWNMKTEKEVVVVQKKGPGILPGCKSLRSVRVAGDEYRTTGGEMGGSPRRQLRLDSATPVTKIQAEAKLTGFDSRSRPLTRSHSPHTSHLLYIQ